MAASFIKKSAIHFGNGVPQRVMEIGTVTFDSDATVEVDTQLKYIEHASFGEIVSGGAANLPTLDETVSSGLVAVDADGQVTVDMTTSTTKTYSYLFIGY